MLDPAGQRQIIQNNLPFLYNFLRKDFQKMFNNIIDQIIFNNHQIIQIISIIIIDY